MSSGKCESADVWVESWKEHGSTEQGDTRLRGMLKSLTAADPLKSTVKLRLRGPREVVSDTQKI